MIRRYGLYTAANVLAMFWTLFAVTREWVFEVTDDTQLELVVLTLPLALLAAAAATVLVSWALPIARRDAFLRRHFAIYLVTPVLLFLLSRGGVTTQHLGAVYVLGIAAWTAHALEGLWHIVANLSDRRAALTLAAVLLVPYFALVPYVSSTAPTASDAPFFLVIVTAALAAQLYLACRDLRIAHRPALIGVALAGLTHPILSYTTQVYPELLAALAFVSAARFVRAGRASRPLALAAAVAAFGLFVLLDALSFALANDKQLLTLVPHVGTVGLLFDRTFGLIPRSPIYLIAALGVIPLWRRGPSASFLVLFVGWLVAFIFSASNASWSGDGAPPSRYILVGLPALVVLLAAGIERLASMSVPAWRTVGAGLAAFSLFIAYVFAVLPNTRYDVAADIRLTDRDGQLFEFVGRLARPDPAVAFPSIVRGAPLDFALGAAWLALVVALMIIGGTEVARRNRQTARPTMRT